MLFADVMMVIIAMCAFSCAGSLGVIAKHHLKFDPPTPDAPAEEAPTPKSGFGI